jgi:cellulose synthase/poly-beta-1,6-N-acetylglucosamine synthase-like glycosyltransferase
VSAQVPRISAVMSVYNGENHLREAIDSILGQTLADFEFLIIDDGSTNETAEVVTRQRLALVLASSGLTRAILVKRGLLSAALRRLSVIRGWALRIVTAHLFRPIVREAWFTRPTDPLSRRARLARAWLDFSRRYPDVLTPRRRLRLVAQLMLGLRSETLTRFHEPDVRGGDR